MFRYIDHFFDESSYNKLVIHFKVNEISHAEKSVDGRMEREILDGEYHCSYFYLQRYFSFV